MNNSSPIYHRIPVVVESLADLDTPLSVYLKLASGPYSYLLESSQGGEKWGRYSIIGLPARTIIKVHGDQTTVTVDGTVTEQHQTDDPLSFIEQFQARYQVADDENLPRFYGGLVGYFGYDTVRYVEKRLRDTTPPDPLGTPDILLMVSEEVVVFDNVKGRMQLISLVDPAQENIEQITREKLQARARALKQAVPPIPEARSNQQISEHDFVSEFGEDAFKASVDRIKEYTRAGDVMQVVLAQRMSIPFESAPINLYRALRSLNPSPYMYFMDLDEFQIVSSSPEILARLENGQITNRPLAGTRRRGHTDAEDQALEEELLADPKEIAEHLMLIDLGRNDVGRVAETGTVEVTEKFVIERYSHVMHIVSNAIGQLAPDCHAWDLLKACFPAGTVSGAPKIRAMEIIGELEGERRGPYSGTYGYYDFQGQLNAAITIRTMIVRKQPDTAADANEHLVNVQAGAGLVADSDPEKEYQETLNKARGLLEAMRCLHV